MLDVLQPVSSIMSKDLITVNPNDSLFKVKEIFAQKSIHHLPVVNFRKIVGMISKTDVLAITDGLGKIQRFSKDEEEQFLKHKSAEDIMTTGLGKLEPTDRINVAINIFAMNYFHALPVIENNELVGIVTTHDIIKAMDKASVEMV